MPIMKEEKSRDFLKRKTPRGVWERDRELTDEHNYYFKRTYNKDCEIISEKKIALDAALNGHVNNA